MHRSNRQFIKQTKILISGLILMSSILCLSGFVQAEEQSMNSGTSPDQAVQISQSFIDINTADAKQLATLSNIGLKKAQEIILYREKNGLFGSIDDLKQVKGIGQSIVEKNRHRIQVAKK